MSPHLSEDELHELSFGDIICDKKWLDKQKMYLRDLGSTIYSPTFLLHCGRVWDLEKIAQLLYRCDPILFVHRPPAGLCALGVRAAVDGPLSSIACLSMVCGFNPE